VKLKVLVLVFAIASLAGCRDMFATCDLAVATEFAEEVSAVASSARDMSLEQLCENQPFQRFEPLEVVDDASESCRGECFSELTNLARRVRFADVSQGTTCEAPLREYKEARFETELEIIEEVNALAIEFLECVEHVR